MRYLTILFVFMLVGCVPYQQQVDTMYNRVLEESKPGETVINEKIFHNQLNYENHNLQNGKYVTLRRILPSENLPETYDILIIDDFLLIPIQVQKNVLNHSTYYLVWNGNYVVDDQNVLFIDLIFMQSIPDNIRIPAFHSGPAFHAASNKGPFIFTKAMDGSIIPVSAESLRESQKEKYPVNYILFDLTKLRDAYSNSVYLNLLGLDGPMEYRY